MKRLLLIFSLLLLALNVYGRELVHAYFGDYKDIVRLVFVTTHNARYNTLQDTDNRAFYINIDNTVQRQDMLPMDLSNCQLIDSVHYERLGNNLRVSINTNTVYYAETFYLRERNTAPLSGIGAVPSLPQGQTVYKIVVDIFRQREPWDRESTQNYITFFETVGYHDRAAALRRRLAAGQFGTAPQPVVQPQPAPVYTPPPAPTTPVVTLDNPLLYLKPDTTGLTDAQRNWINEAFRLYDLFKNIHQTIAEAERTLGLYDAQRTVDITFVEAMSRSYNSLSEANITLNEIRLQFRNLLQRHNFNPTVQTEYTRTMINHILGLIDGYQTKVTELQGEYNRRINR